MVPVVRNFRQSNTVNTDMDLFRLFRRTSSGDDSAAEQTQIEVKTVQPPGSASLKGSSQPGSPPYGPSRTCSSVLDTVSTKGKTDTNASPFQAAASHSFYGKAIWDTDPNNIYTSDKHPASVRTKSRKLKDLGPCQEPTGVVRKVCVRVQAPQPTK